MGKAKHRRGSDPLKLLGVFLTTIGVVSLIVALNMASN